MTEIVEIALRFAALPDISPEGKSGQELKTVGSGIVLIKSEFDNSQSWLFKRMFLAPLDVNTPKDKDGKPLLPASMVISKYLLSKKDAPTEYYDLYKWMATMWALGQGDDNVDLWEQVNKLFAHNLTAYEFIQLKIGMAYLETTGEVIVSEADYENFFKSVDYEAQIPPYSNNATIAQQFNTDVEEAEDMQLSQLKSIQEAQAELEPDSKGGNFYPTSTFILDAVYSVVLDASNPAVTSPLSFFNGLVVNTIIPFIAYIAPEGKSFVKIYKQSITPVPPEKKLRTPGNIFFQIQMGKLINFTIDLKTRFLSFESRNDNLPNVIGALKLLGFNIEEKSLLKSNFSVNITLERNERLDPAIRSPVITRRSWLYSMLTDKQFFNHIQLNEQKRSNFMRSTILMRYRPFDDILRFISINTTVVVVGDEESKEQKSVSLHLDIIRSSAGKVMFQAKNVKSSSDINALQKILGRLVYVHQAAKIAVESKFTLLFGIDHSNKENDRARSLRTAAPVVFNNEYFDIHPDASYPTLVSPDEMKSGVNYVRFFIAGYDLLMTNSDSKYPYFGIKVSKNPTSVPYFPLYFKKPQMGGNVMTPFNKLMRLGKPQRSIKENKYTNLDSYIIKHGGIGQIPISLRTFLTELKFGNGPLVNPNEKITRRGINSSAPPGAPTPMLNAVYVATLHDPFLVKGHSSRGYKGITKKYSVLDDVMTGDMARDINTYRQTLTTIDFNVSR